MVRINFKGNSFIYCANSCYSPGKEQKGNLLHRQPTHEGESESFKSRGISGRVSAHTNAPTMLLYGAKVLGRRRFSPLLSSLRVGELLVDRRVL